MWLTRRNTEMLTKEQILLMKKFLRLYLPQICMYKRLTRPDIGTDNQKRST